MKLSRAKVKFHKRNGRKCWYCGKALAFRIRKKVSREFMATVDHQKPLSRGGYDRRDNKVTACLTCNNEKGSRTVEEYRVFLMQTRQSGYVSFYGEG